MCNLLMQIDRTNGYFYDPEKLRNEKETQIDYEAVERYIDTEALLDIEEKYLEHDDDDDHE